MTEFSISGMTCTGCVAAVTRALRGLAPAAEVAVDLAAGRARIDGPAPPADVLAAAVQAAGFGVGDPK